MNKSNTTTHHKTQRRHHPLRSDILRPVFLHGERLRLRLRREPSCDARRRKRRAVHLRSYAGAHLLPALVLAEEVAAEAEQDGEEDEGQGDHQNEPHPLSFLLLNPIYLPAWRS
jgi:hypothetical protein